MRAEVVFVAGSVVMLLATGMPCFADVHIRSVMNEAIVFDSEIAISGVVSAEIPEEKVVLTIGGISLPGVVPVMGKWTVPNVALKTGANRISVQYGGGASHEILVTFGPRLQPRPPQRVCFVWEHGVDEELHELAKGTLANPTAGQLEAFAIGVREATVEVFRKAYLGVAAVQIVDGPGPGVHQIVMSPDENSMFGYAVYDLGNGMPEQECVVGVKYLRELMVDSVSQGKWLPMQGDDDLQVRIDDVSNSLGRTAAHEAGHSFGLVGAQGKCCAWMEGCEGEHHSPDFADRHKGIADRFRNGWSIMDGGDATLLKARIAVKDGASRSERQPARFGAFDRAYFSHVLPVP